MARDINNWKSSIHRIPEKAQHIVTLQCSVKVQHIVYPADLNGIKKMISQIVHRFFNLIFKSIYLMNNHLFIVI